MISFIQFLPISTHIDLSDNFISKFTSMGLPASKRKPANQANWQTRKLANWQTGKLANWQTGKLANQPQGSSIVTPTKKKKKTRSSDKLPVGGSKERKVLSDFFFVAFLAKVCKILGNLILGCYC